MNQYHSLHVVVTLSTAYRSQRTKYEEYSNSALFRCVLASLYEVVSVGPSDGPSDSNPFFLNAENEPFSL